MTKKEIKCPQCGHLTFYSLDNPFRPFCSERCRLIDLGDWASENYKISHTNNNQDHDEDENNLTPTATQNKNEADD